MSDDPLLECRAVTKRFGALTALSQVSLSLHRAERVAIMGPSGAGKSVLLRVLSLPEAPDAGEVLFDGLTVRKAGRATHAARQESWRGRFGFVFQDHSLWPHRNVLGNVAEPLRVVKGMGKREAREVARTALEDVGMLARESERIDNLSGGESQRVAIARAIAMDPDVLFFDEITSALDPPHVAGILQLIRALAADPHRAMLIVTHHISFARAVAGRFVFLHGGHVLYDGAPEPALWNAGPPELLRFLDSAEAMR